MFDFGSNTPMDTQKDIEHRLMELEIKASYADDLLEQLNQTIFRQQQQIEHLGRELSTLRDQIPEGGSTLRSLRDDMPPHY